MANELRYTLIFFLLMVLGVLSYFVVTGEFLTGGTLAFFTGFANELGITVHELAFMSALFYMVMIPLFVIPTIILIVRATD